MRRHNAIADNGLPTPWVARLVFALAMPKRNRPRRKVGWWLPAPTVELIKVEARRLSIQPGALLALVIAERSQSFNSRPIEVIASEPTSADQ